MERFLADETLSVEALSQELGLSRTQLHRKLKALTDQAPGDLIRLIQLQQAHELLASGVATVAELACQVGYGNPASFSRRFGYAPSSTARHAKGRLAHGAQERCHVRPGSYLGGRNTLVFSRCA